MCAVHGRCYTIAVGVDAAVTVAAAVVGEHIFLKMRNVMCKFDVFTCTVCFERIFTSHSHFPMNKKKSHEMG